MYRLRVSYDHHGKHWGLTAAIGPYPIGFTNSATNCWDLWPGEPSTGFQSIVDGTSNTIMTGELQRITSLRRSVASRDGWAVGGDATLFSTGRSAAPGRQPTPRQQRTSHARQRWCIGAARQRTFRHRELRLGRRVGAVLADLHEREHLRALGSMADRTPAGPDSQ